MALEIERKFLVNISLFPSGIEGVRISQGYLHISKQKSVRVRIAGYRAFITIKGPDHDGVRAEFEYEIPPQDAGEMLEKFCANAVVSKIRRRLVWKNHSWEVDEFLGDNEGLWLAEIELDERNEAFEFPQWLGNEVTGDEKFYNTYLSLHPFASW